MHLTAVKSMNTEISSTIFSRAAATSKTDSFMIIVNCWKPLAVITNLYILVAKALDPPLVFMVLFRVNVKLVL